MLYEASIGSGNYEVSMTQVLQCVYTVNHDPAMTMTYFTAMSNLETLAFTWEKVKSMDF